MQKKSILFIADKPDWAYHNIIKTWYPELEDYDCYIAFAQDFFIRVKKFSLIEKMVFNFLNSIRLNSLKYNIHPSLKFSYPVYQNNPVRNLKTSETEKTDFDCIIEMAYYFQYVSEFPFTSKKKLIGIYTDSFPHEGPSFDAKTDTDLKTLSRKNFFEQYLKSYDGVIVGNTNLYNDYTPFTNKLVFANGILRQADFEENKNFGRNEGLVIGWTGTPNRPMKGFNEIIVPAVEEVQKTGRKIELKTQFSGTYESLLSFYKDVDLVVIASEADTGPSLFSEASLSSVPSISTEIGFPKMVIRNGENGIFVKRDIEEMKNAIIDLYDNREKLITFSERIKKDYLNVLDNQISITNLKSFLSQCLEH